MGKKRRLPQPVTSSVDDDSSKVGFDRPNDDNERKGGIPPPSSSSDNEPPTRNTEQLYASHVTYDCTMNRECIPCAYKIGCFDVALDKEFCRRRPNQRPDQCPRSKVDYNTAANNNTDTDDGVLGFRRGMSILTVGDGDFSFSLGIAQRLLQQKKFSSDGKDQKTFIVATSYETEATLRKVYPDFDKTLRRLDELGVIVAYSVDATRIFDTLSVSAKGRIKTIKGRFHRICWNFPCTAISNGQDGQNKAMEENKNLVRKFVQNARSILTGGGDGELCLCHKTKPPYNQWNLEEVALSSQKDDCDSTTKSPPLLFYSGRIVLDRFLLPPYTPRKALDRKSFPCHDACFYIFAQKSSDEPAVKRKNLFLPTIPHKEQPAAGNKESRRENRTSQMLIKVTTELLQLIRERHINATPRKKRKRNTKHTNRSF
ncbi:unnamed protein product [Pseudo-nitzschia multistriata]|uniref:25S rRNA (uridine-N(3))-methyltransferase BMT5-like domain-containing protein n=1 Tax=Pseudo-nitzschia multistriata TaxID=183589 RepID=A0A448ZKT2_9STRA|nr:unnamed protein product [Pseudo-nitzschia multistriata]